MTITPLSGTHPVAPPGQSLLGRSWNGTGVLQINRRNKAPIPTAKMQHIRANFGAVSHRWTLHPGDQPAWHAVTGGLTGLRAWMNINVASVRTFYGLQLAPPPSMAPTPIPIFEVRYLGLHFVTIDFTGSSTPATWDYVWYWHTGPKRSGRNYAGGSTGQALSIGHPGLFIFDIGFVPEPGQMMYFRASARDPNLATGYRVVQCQI